MQTDNAAEFLVKELEKWRMTVVDQIVSKSNTMEEYHRLRGVVQGLEYAKQTVTDLAKKVAEDE